MTEKQNMTEIFPEGYAFNLSDFALFLAVMKNRFGCVGGKPLITGRSIWKWKIICMM